MEYNVAAVVTEPVAFAFDSVESGFAAFDSVASGFVAFDFVAFATFVVVASRNEH